MYIEDWLVFIFTLEFTCEIIGHVPLNICICIYHAARLGPTDRLSAQPSMDFAYMCVCGAITTSLCVGCQKYIPRIFGCFSSLLQMYTLYLFVMQIL